MEASAIKQTSVVGAHGRSPLLRLQSDERLVALVRRGNQHAFEALVARYQSRLLAFCRHMLSSREDAEDVLQEVFAAAFNAMLADNRPINVRPWLYRIARNRSLNHLRRVPALGVDSMDTHLSEHGISTAEKVHRREDFRMLITDVQDLPETQRTALLLREIDALSYEQIAEAMDNTVPSVKSLLVRARVGLAEAAEARTLDCEDVRLELGEVAEGLKRMSSPVRRHLRSCDRCAGFKKQLATTNRALAALLPVGPLFLLKKTLLAHLGTTAAASGSAAATSTAAGGAIQLGISTAATKAAAGLAAAALVTAGAVEVKHVANERIRPAATVTAAAPAATPEAAAVTPVGGTSLLPATGPNLLASGTPPVETTESAAQERADADAAQRVEQAADDAKKSAAEESDGDPLPATAPDVLVAAGEPVAAGMAVPGAGVPLAVSGEPVVAGPLPAPPPGKIESVVRPDGAVLGSPSTGVATPGRNLSGTGLPNPISPPTLGFPAPIAVDPVPAVPVAGAPPEPTPAAEDEGPADAPGAASVTGDPTDGATPEPIGSAGGIVTPEPGTEPEAAPVTDPAEPVPTPAPITEPVEPIVTPDPAPTPVTEPVQPPTVAGSVGAPATDNSGV